MQDYGLFFKSTRSLVRIFRRPFVMKLPLHIKGPVVFVARHQNLRGPFTLLLSTDRFIRVWMLDVFLEWRTCYKQYVDYTFTKRYRLPRGIAIALAWLPAYLIATLMKSARGLPVYRNRRKVIDTLNESVNSLKRGEHIAIFPEIDYTNTTEQIGNIYEGFLNLEKYYYKETGEHVIFMPLIINQSTKSICAKQPITFIGNMPFKEERASIAKRLHEALMDG